MTASHLEDYCRSLGGQAGRTIRRLDTIIRGWQPALPVTIWQSMGFPIIGYGRASYRAGGIDKQWFIVGLAAHKSYFSLYVWGIRPDGYLLDTYERRLGKVKVGKACLNFKHLEDLDLPNLRLLVNEAVELQKNHPGGSGEL